MAIRPNEKRKRKSNWNAPQSERKGKLTFAPEINEKKIQ